MVIKRDNSKVDFDARKIVNAINKAFIEVDGQLYENDTATDIAIDIGKNILIQMLMLKQFRMMSKII